MIGLLAFVLFPSSTAGAQHSTFVSPDPQAFGRFGWSVSPAGDVDGDGIPDALIGAHTEDAGGVENSGRTYVISGSDGSVIRALVSPNPEAEGRFGWTLSSAGDVTSDGVPDVLVGVPLEDAGGFEDSGRVYMLSGSDGSVIHTFESPDATDGGTFGRSVASIDDVDGDQIPDVLIGAAFEPVGALAGSGRAYMFSGLDGTLLHTLVSPNAEVEGQFGSSVAALGDLDGDGTHDILAGAHAEDTGGVKDSGRAYAFSGSDGTLLHTLVSPNAEQLGVFSRSLSAAGDIDGDGVSDILIGASDEDAGGFFDSGRVYIFSGQTGVVFLAQGDHVFILHGAGLPSGVYHVRAIGESFTHTRKVVFLK